jgi:hypothetical protein
VVKRDCLVTSVLFYYVVFLVVILMVVLIVLVMKMAMIHWSSITCCHLSYKISLITKEISEGGQYRESHDAEVKL